MFIPISDDNSRRYRFPFVVWALVCLNCFAWYLELMHGERFLVSYAAIPFEITHHQDLVGTQYLPTDHGRVPLMHGPGPDPIYLTIFTSMFLHGSWMHIIGNMVYLLIFGDQIEDEMGHLKFLLFYLIAGVVACLAQVFAEPNSTLPCVGASGAIAGVLGAYLILHPRNPVRVFVIRSIVVLPAWLVLGFWIVMQLMGHANARLVGSTSGVAYMAHVGGFAVGFVVSVMVRLGRRPKSGVHYR